MAKPKTAIESEARLAKERVVAFQKVVNLIQLGNPKNVDMPAIYAAMDAVTRQCARVGSIKKMHDEMWNADGTAKEVSPAVE